MCLVRTRGVPGNFAANFLNIVDSGGENGRADRYKCGVLCSMTPAKVRMNRWASLIAPLISLYWA
jgi:hypothetical protein